MAEEKSKPSDKQPALPPLPPENKTITSEDTSSCPQTKMISENRKK